MSDKILFFGYGANSNRSKIKQIINRDPGEGVGAILQRYILCSQNMSQVPEPARSDLDKIFGSHFRAYTIKPGKGIVLGILWEISEKELELIGEWEYVGVWREIVEVDVISSGQEKVTAFTERAKNVSETEKLVDGLAYSLYDFTEIMGVEQEDPFYTEKRMNELRALLESHNK